MLAITPVITGAIGIFFTRALPYGYVLLLSAVVAAIPVLLWLQSPVAPAISAGLLPLVLGVDSWWYPAGIMLGTILLALLSIVWKRVSVAYGWLAPFNRAELLDE